MTTAEMPLDEIICADVLQTLKGLPDNCIDVSVTSPPYNKGEDKKGWLVTNVKYHHSGDRMPERVYQDWQVEVLNEVYRITKPGGSFFYNHKIRWERGVLIHPYSWITQTRWTMRQEIIWDRMIAGNIRGWRFWQVDERIYWLIKPDGSDKIGKELKSRHALLCSIWRFPPERENEHPAPFPLQLPLRAIYSVLDDSLGKLVLDPFCGAGTTLVAAKLLGYNYIGIDVSPEYVAMAVKRLSEYNRESEKARMELAKHVVTKTFTERKAKGDFTGRYGPSGKQGKRGLPLFKMDD
ncbi:MAG: site-specific DNA-methyltransferase [Calditrichota bacterium]